ncbi:MAG: hypothetical protein M4579_003175 [Chaenotheca gracillima]|nr:MAG: hypothetical protein M4579_003175 [Chaenotheca gracillima]
MRLPYAPTTPPDDAGPNAAIYERIAARRAPRPLTSLDLALLHAPPIADGWNTFLGAIRTKNNLPASVFELAICRVAVLNGAVYEWTHHAPLAVKGGVSADGMETIRLAPEGAAAAGRKSDGEGGLSRREWAVLAYTDQMTKGVTVDDGVFARVREDFEEAQVVELTATVAAYNCVSRFLVALDVGEANGGEIKGVQDL